MENTLIQITRDLCSQKNLYFNARKGVPFGLKYFITSLIQGEEHLLTAKSV